MILGINEFKELLKSGKAIFINCHFPETVYSIPTDTEDNLETNIDCKLIEYIKKEINYPTMNEKIIEEILEAEANYYRENY